MGTSDLINRIRIGTTLDKKLFENFKLLSNDTRITQSKLMDEAIEDLLKKYGKDAIKEKME